MDEKEIGKQGKLRSYGGFSKRKGDIVREGKIRYFLKVLAGPSLVGTVHKGLSFLCDMNSCCLVQLLEKCRQTVVCYMEYYQLYQKT